MKKQLLSVALLSLLATSAGAAPVGPPGASPMPPSSAEPTLPPAIPDIPIERMGAPRPSANPAAMPSRINQARPSPEDTRAAPGRVDRPLSQAKPSAQGADLTPDPFLGRSGDINRLGLVNEELKLRNQIAQQELQLMQLNQQARLLKPQAEAQMVKIEGDIRKARESMAPKKAQAPAVKLNQLPPPPPEPIAKKPLTQKNPASPVAKPEPRPEVQAIAHYGKHAWAKVKLGDETHKVSVNDYVGQYRVLEIQPGEIVVRKGEAGEPLRLSRGEITYVVTSSEDRTARSSTESLPTPGYEEYGNGIFEAGDGLVTSEESIEGLRDMLLGR